MLTVTYSCAMLRLYPDILVNHSVNDIRPNYIKLSDFSVEPFICTNRRLKQRRVIEFISRRGMILTTQLKPVMFLCSD